MQGDRKVKKTGSIVADEGPVLAETGLSEGIL
jgi:hypothetical protein